jgi:hypothetical protein
MKGYKAFHKGLICKDKQYKENTVFEEKEAIPCVTGMHFCENPMDVLTYYPLIDDEGEFSDFAEVEALDEVKTDNDKKFCTTRLKIGAKLSFAGFINACVDFILEKTRYEPDECDEDSAKIGSSGYSAQIGSSGDYAQIKCTGDDSVVCCAGYNSCASAKKGCWITLSEWKYSKEKDRFVPTCVKTEYVDGEKIKEDTMYSLKDGEFVEVCEHNE